MVFLDLQNPISGLVHVLRSPPETNKTAISIADDYRPWLYNRTDQCPDDVYYRVVYGYDPHAEFDAYLIQYFMYWDCQVCTGANHEYDYEPIFIWVQTLGERPYRVAYDHWDAFNFHTHEIHRTHLWSGLSDGAYDVPGGTVTNEKAYYPYGNASYDGDEWGKELILANLSISLQNNWDGNHVELGIANCWHTFDNDTSGTNCSNDALQPLVDNTALIIGYRLELDDESGSPCCTCGVEAFKYDVSDPFDHVFWEDHYHRDHDLPTINAALTTIEVDLVGETLTVNLSAYYDNSDAEGGSGWKHLIYLWEDRFDATLVNGSGDVELGEPTTLEEYSPGNYTLEFDDIPLPFWIYNLTVNITDNLDENEGVDQYPIDPCEMYDTNGTPGIQVDEAVAAVNDYFDYLIALDVVIAVINCYYG